MTDTDRPAIELIGVSKAHGDAPPVLVGLDLAVGAGEIVAVAGRSGSGKTTLLSLIAGWEHAQQGSVHVLGRPQPEDLPWRDLAIVPQSLGMLDELTLAENIASPQRLARVRASGSRAAAAPSRATDAAAVTAVIQRLGLDRCANRYPSEVSLGEQQRAALARATVMGPAVLIADEPIAHQNTGWAREMMRLLVDLSAAGTAILLATHNEIAFESARRILHLRTGQLVTAGAP
jgi:putative ABC transport system ATP-binding protein